MTIIVYFFIGVLLVNGLPHFIQGICGNTFQTPFAKPAGVGESSALINVIWGVFNFIAAYSLAFYVGFVSLGHNSPTDILIAGALVCALILAAHFGKIRRAK